MVFANRTMFNVNDLFCDYMIQEKKSDLHERLRLDDDKAHIVWPKSICKISISNTHAQYFNIFKVNFHGN